MFKMSTIHANTCIQTTTPLRNRSHDDAVVQQFPLPQQTFFQLLHNITDGRPSLEAYHRCCSSPDLNRIRDVVKELTERLLREWRLLDHSVIAAAIAQWCSRLNACVRVNGGHFKLLDFLLCFVCFTDAGFCKCDRYKHVQSANIGMKRVTFVSETFTQYGSNITNVWQETFYASDFGILLRSCARKIMKIRQYL